MPIGTTNDRGRPPGIPPSVIAASRRGCHSCRSETRGHRLSCREASVSPKRAYARQPRLLGRHARPAHAAHRRARPAADRDDHTVLTRGRLTQRRQRRTGASDDDRRCARNEASSWRIGVARVATIEASSTMTRGGGLVVGRGAEHLSTASRSAHHAHDSRYGRARGWEQPRGPCPAAQAPRSWPDVPDRRPVRLAACNVSRGPARGSVRLTGRRSDDGRRHDGGRRSCVLVRAAPERFLDVAGFAEIGVQPIGLSRRQRQTRRVPPAVPQAGESPPTRRAISPRSAPVREIARVRGLRDEHIVVKPST